MCLKRFKNRSLASVLALMLLSSTAYAQTHGSVATSKDLLLNEAGAVYWESVKKRAIAELAAEKATDELETFRAHKPDIDSSNSVSGSDKPDKGSVTSGTRFTWEFVSVGRGSDGKPYALFRSDKHQRRLTSGDHVGVWRVMIEESGLVVVTHADQRLTF